MANPDPNSNWISLKVALVWTLTRDSQIVANFVEAAGRGYEYRIPSDDWAANDKEWDWLTGWSQLKNFVIVGKINLRGEAYEESPVGLPTEPLARVNLLNPAPYESEEEDEDEGSAVEETSAPLRDILRNDVGRLVLDPNGEFRLRPATWALAGGRGWRNVVVERDILLQVFTGATTVASASIATNSAENENHAVVEAFMKIYPLGLKPGERAKIRNAKIQEYLRETVGWVVSEPTIRRALRTMKIKRDQ